MTRSSVFLRNSCLVLPAFMLLGPACKSSNGIPTLTEQTGGASGGGATGGSASGGSSGYVVAMLQSAKNKATDLTQDDVTDLVSKAISQAGGLDFIKDGQTVVLKPNLVTPYADTRGTVPLNPLVNGIATDWRVVKAVADLVRAKNPKGKILVMEGSVVPAATAFNILGYTTTNFGKSVDEFLAFEGESCTDRSTTKLVKKTSHGKDLWLNKRYAEADVVISIPTMKTHKSTGITGAVKNLGIGATPVGQYAAPTQSNSNDCTRGQTASYIDHSTPETLGEFIRIYYSARPADFAVMDGLQGLQNGPASQWTSNNLEGDQMNMRLILAGRNAVAVDTVEALVMKCDPKLVPHLTKLEGDGLGTTDISKINVVGKAIADVAKPFATSAATASICPGK